jgi:hypothetical protein
VTLEEAILKLVQGMVHQQGTRLRVTCTPRVLDLVLDEPVLPLDPQLLLIDAEALVLAPETSALRDLAQGLAGLDPLAAGFDDFALVGAAPNRPVRGEEFVVALQLDRRPGGAMPSPELLAARLALCPIPVLWNGERLAENHWQPPDVRRFRPRLFPADYYRRESLGVALRPPSPSVQLDGTGTVFYRWFRDDAAEDELELVEDPVGPYFFLLEPALECSWLYPVQAGVLLDRVATRLPVNGLHLVVDAPELHTEGFQVVQDERLRELENRLRPDLVDFHRCCLERYASLESDQSGSEITSGIVASCVLAVPVGGGLGTLLGSGVLGVLAFGAAGVLLTVFGRLPFVRKFSWAPLNRARFEESVRRLQSER